MNHKLQQDSETGWIRQPPAGSCLAGAAIFLMLTLFSILLPYFSGQHIYFAIFSGALGFISFLWLNLRPNLYARFFLNTALASLFGLIAVRSFIFLFPTYSVFVGVLIIVTVAFAHALPMWNVRLARFLRDEISSPKTNLGKRIFRGSLLVAPIVGILSAAVALFLLRGGKSAAISLLLGFLGWFIALLLPFIYQFPSSPWEDKENGSIPTGSTRR